ncbi:Glycoside hydrolase, clan GH-D [Candidatus Sulfopaludibacter sp. SbA6]|nr:Glycoside hydrolase, clan GH-D [Candidatus Sulfopaludibacter sp. SbA6]
MRLNSRRLLLAVVLMASAAPARLCGQSQTNPTAIQFIESRKTWLLTTRESSYAMAVSANGTLEHLYWGAPLWRADDLPAASTQRDISSFDPHQMLENEEYPGWGGPRYYEPALKIARPDGNRDLVLEYVSHRILGDDLDITLKDIRDDIEVTLHYRVYPEYGILARNSTIRNRTNRPLTVDSAQSATWHMPPGGGYQLSYLTGRWAAETQLNREPVHEGMKVLESRKGHTSHNINPWFALSAGDATGDASEENGRVWFGALAWSGNWRITVEQTPYRQVRVTGGLNTFDFAYQLKPGESLDTPQFFAGFSAGGFGGASRLLHRFEREKILPGGASSRVRPVLYNSWEATTFSVNEDGQELLADKAAKLGVELFVMDDGWFGKRNNDRAGLGDWFVNPQKFPQGLKPLIDHVNQLGMDFGLWVEPEMVNADSDLYRSHPDWVINFPGRPRSELRTQMILNLARSDVKEYVFGFLDKLASQYNIRYFKWDMNRSFSEPGWPEMEPADQRKLWVEYVRNVYEVMDRLRARHPKLEIESCSGGGGRVDLGILQRVDEVWASDNTEAFDRLRIQEGFSQAYAAKVMSAWVTDVPNMNTRSTPLEFRFLVAMQGALGIGANLNRWTESDSAMATRMIALYKRIRHTVQEGNLYRLMSPRLDDVTANEYVSDDGRQAVLFAFRHSQEYNTAAPAIRLRGLDERAVYKLESVDGKLVEKQPQLSGAYLMRAGLNVNLRGDFDSTAVVLERVN